MLGGNPTVYGIDPFSTSSNPLHKVGTKGVTAEGRLYRYARNGSTALNPGELCKAADLTANHEDRAFATAGAVGDTSVSISIGATNIVANEYVDGHLVIIDDTGEGHAHRITKHGVNSGAADVTFYIEPGLEEATTTSTTVTLVRNPFSGVVVTQASSDQLDIPTGVPNLDVAASEYFWIQTGGTCAVLQDATITAGNPVTIGSSTAGAVEARDAVAEPLVGIVPAGVNTTDTEFNPVYLLIDTN